MKAWVGRWSPSPCGEGLGRRLGSATKPLPPAGHPPHKGEG